jgi:hypothetical protein
MFRRTSTTLFAGSVVLAMGVATARGEIFPLSANMTNAGEPGGVTPTLTAANGGGARPASFGTATMVLNTNDPDPANWFMTFTAEVNNIDFTGTQTADTNDNLSNAHIHASDTVTPTTNAGVVWGFIGAPQNTADDVVVTPFATGVGGTVTATWDAPEGNNTTLGAQIARLTSVHAYVNFHTTQFPGGEIRGMIVPEPSAAAALLAFGCVGLVRRRRRS